MMEAIDKASVQEFADKVAAQVASNAKTIADLQAQTLRMQGAKAAVDYILALDPIVLDEGDYVDGDYDVDLPDDVDDTTVQEVINYLDDPVHYDEVYGEYVEPAATAVEAAP